MSVIYQLREHNNPPERLASYSCEPKQALINFIMQDIHDDFNTWNYPSEILGMWESTVAPNHWYYDDFKNKRVLAAHPY